ncbi:phage integrase N-terminal SAM-like domain-containing protein [Aeromonas caviae]|uniref:phage integrase N-terminal SAM-like domain-containing protein n=1 Tax=Aeromonas caviae TaxID=648 RepID=UPI0029DE8C9D|nr:phage integrase N-terminal SAM-like domain-containing protein [Aeromonas caviae]
MEGASKPRLRKQVRTVMRLHHYSIRTEKSYWFWIRILYAFINCDILRNSVLLRSMPFSCGFFPVYQGVAITPWLDGRDYPASPRGANLAPSRDFSYCHE